MILKTFLLLYRVAWVFLLPLYVTYIMWRSRRDPLYSQYLLERFAIYKKKIPQNAIWLHAVSLGETRSASALITRLLNRGDKVIVTNFTPTGRRAAEQLFAPEIASGQMAVVWVPFDMMWTYRRFLRACRPRIGLTLEVEIWPSMIFATKRAGVPLYMCNGQYASQSLARDSRGLRIRQRVMRGLAGAFVKSRSHAERFSQIGLQNVTITGELRFDQPIPQDQIDIAAQVRHTSLGAWQDVIVIASGVEGEEDLYINLIKTVHAAANLKGCQPPLFVYVPRAPERFDILAEKLTIAGIKYIRRSQYSTPDLRSKQPFFSSSPAVFLGDSLGEMFFYLSLSDRVVVGGGFTPRGAHNVIEPLTLKKPVLTGPFVRTIEYPFVEAEAAGIASMVDDIEELAMALSAPLENIDLQINTFLKEHSGADCRTLAAIDIVLKNSQNTYSK
jgi:3-deoxy-D-manno-octulosonic-acid transferase